MSNMVNMDMSEFWNGDGGRKWLRFQDRIDASLIDFGQEVMAATAISAGERVLDIGCGCGDTSFEMAHYVGPFGQVQGVDISELILEQGRSRAASAGQYNISFECADAQSHHFESMTFDVAFSRFGVMFFDNPIAAFDNIRRALQPRGRLAFICWQPINSNQWVSLPLDIAANHVPLPAASAEEEPGAFSFGNANRIVHILAEAGFSDISIERFDTMFNVGRSLDEAVTFLSNIGPASNAIEAANMDEISKARFLAELRTTLVPYKTLRGVELGAATWVVTANNQ
ncbi:class I SAM-dependent methyltransferase [Sulfuriflexus mobilis]|uniref:class I SAM-dependent methyltransferase n=1 Tax=Sulfuriflexus mobilis TaxID=1811807 RepID=UPI0015591310|nr:class I SAM-dependent methyltransferase [Sulfuriflexus mobilis]